MTEPNFLRTTVAMLAGLLIWAAHFTFVYVFTALACARGFTDVKLLGTGIVPLTVGAATAVALLAAGAVLIRAQRRRSTGNEARRFETYAAEMMALLGLIGIAWSGLAAVTVPACP